MFSVGSMYTWQNHSSFLHTAQIRSELLECSEWHKCPLPRALTGVSSAPGEPLPQFSWTQMLLPTLGEHQGSPVWVQMERFHPSRFLSTGKAQKDRNVNQPFTRLTLTGVGTNRFCDIHLPRNKLQSQLCWCKPGQTPEVWKPLHLHQNKWKQQCPLAETPSPLFLCCTCGSAQCPGTISAHWRRSGWLLHSEETSHNLSHIKILPLVLSQEDSASSQYSVPSPCPCWGWADGAPCPAELHTAANSPGASAAGQGKGRGRDQRSLWGCCSLWRW